jgi:hypothetical protein
MKGVAMTEPHLFEEMLTTYPTEKRELARMVYHRFADGDSEQFFTQLCGGHNCFRSLVGGASFAGCHARHQQCASAGVDAGAGSFAGRN